MKMYIPSIGDQIQVIKDWEFDLYNESRNETLMERLGDTRDTSYGNKLTTIKATIPVGAVLKIDRIYIRKGLDEYSSITFLWKGESTQSRYEERESWQIPAVNLGEMLSGITPRGSPARSTYQVKIPRRPVRFWAKLDDVNNIEFDPA